MCKASKVKTKEELLSVAQEIAFAKALAANDKTLRNRALKKVKKWFSLRSQQESVALRFTEEGLMRVWKGLFYCVWMSDKPLVQEEVVETISNLIHSFYNVEDAQKFIVCFFRCISQAWFNLDGHRMDKYLMLVRRFLRQIFEFMYNREWDDDVVDVICEDLKKSFSAAPVGLNLHLAEIYLEELAKVGRGSLEKETVLRILKPFGEVMALSNDTRLIKYIVDFIFLQLIRQSDEGIKYGAKFEVWKQMGFPEGDINVIQEASDEEEISDEDSMDEDMPDMEETGSALDPRAGNVDVLLPPIDFDPRDVNNFLLQLSRRKETTTKARNSLGLLIKKYNKFIEGKYPLGIHKCELPEYEDEEEIIDEKAEELLKEDVEFAMEKKLLKKGNKESRSSSWEVSPIEEGNDDANTNLVSNIGNWEVKKALKRKTSADELICTNMKKIKISEGNSLVEPSNDIEQNLEEKGELKQPALKPNKRKPKKSNIKRTRCKGALSFTPTPQIMKMYNLLLEEETKKHEEKLKKIEQATIEWGIQSDWDTKKEEEIVIPFTPGKSKNSASDKSETPPASRNATSAKKKTPGSGKKVEFVLNRNTAQGAQDYKLSLKKSPSLPFDAEKKPRHGVLKRAPVSSPINPFYMDAE